MYVSFSFVTNLVVLGGEVWFRPISGGLFSGFMGFRNSVHLQKYPFNCGVISDVTGV